MSDEAAIPELVGLSETVSEALNRLSGAGYGDDYRTEADGLLAVVAGCLHTPEGLVIDEVVRFEGASDPDDEAIVFALRCRTHGTRGTYATSYGPNMSAVDAEMVRRLRATAC